MDILDQVAQLLARYEASETSQRTNVELDKAILLHLALEDYADYVRRHQWSAARNQLNRIVLAIYQIIPDLPP